MSTLSFEVFWSWILQHPNCILRAGTHDALVFDDDDLHWHLAGQLPSVYVHVMRGKHLVGEIFLDAERVSYVQALEEDEGEFVFELVSESESDRFLVYLFAMSHAFDADDAPIPGRVH